MQTFRCIIYDMTTGYGITHEICKDETYKILHKTEALPWSINNF